jgi:hypothetical protein
LCKNGFHACKKIIDCFSYYDFNPKNKVAEVELTGDIKGLNGDKQCGQNINIIKEISWEKVLILANSGNGNSGYKNSGDGNSGDGNSGDWNSGYRNSGHFNSKTPEKIYCFNKLILKSTWDNAKKPNFIFNLILNKWICWDSMTDEEKKDAWANAYKTASKKDIKLLKALPGFDKNVFKDITGIEVE